MAETPQRAVHPTRRSNQPPLHFNPKLSPSLTPSTPPTTSPRRSTRRVSLAFNAGTPRKPTDPIEKPVDDSVRETPGRTRKASNRKSPRRSINYAEETRNDSAEKTPKVGKICELPKTPRSTRKGSNSTRKDEESGWTEVEVSFSPVSPDQPEIKKRKMAKERTVITRSRTSKDEDFEKKKKKKKNGGAVPKKRIYYKKVVYDGGEFGTGDDVYVKRREDASSEDEDPEVEDCMLCFKSGRAVMIECDDCLGGFHLKCLKPPLKEVPEGDWICGFCEARKMGKSVQLPKPPEGTKRVRTMREKLLSSDLWAARIESLWKEVDGSYWSRVRWYIIPEETVSGRQPHNLRRELYRTNDFADIEMESILRHCSVMNPKEYAKASNEGDDVFLCEYEYDIHWHSFKRLADIDAGEEDGEDSDEDYKVCKDLDSDTDEDMDYEKESIEKMLAKQHPAHEMAANSRKGRFFGLQKVGMKKIPEHIRCHKQTELERAKATLLLASLPKSLPCRNKETEEITTFIKGAICDDQCLGRCLYIHGVPGTGKTMTVLSVMRNLRSEVDAGSIRPYCFVEINGLKLASPETIYRVIYEALTGHRVSWKKALQLLNERFSEGNKFREEDNRPCILLIDELDLLVTRNQSVLYNILDWPTKPHSKLVIIGIANTMDLPEKLLPRISSRMGIQRLCFGPYNYQQLEEIISSRLKGIDAFEKQAIEFASRKVAAISGDARRALEICRRAAEITDYRLKKLTSTSNDISEGKTLVGMAEVDAAIQEMFQAPHMQVMKNCSRLSKIFLTAMVHELYRTGMGETSFEKGTS
ncbi:origin of replication complex subunit 1-like isoform X2 [Ziziphus jujuba]|uniref:Origin recognition complex subunit 1 n=1 Tax=Ziziphus jujuba TaxID=326968 RepID=A0A6P6FXS3_ZIZJJ|nr:origin of replication complex subunit 1-like isoform X2 [Ziziphus jujuba]